MATEVTENKRKRNNATSFIQAAWACKSYEELAEKLGIERGSVYVRFADYRKRGVKMPTYAHAAGGGHKIDIAALNALVDSLAEAKTEAEAEAEAKPEAPEAT